MLMTLVVLLRDPIPICHSSGLVHLGGGGCVPFVGGGGGGQGVTEV